MALKETPKENQYLLHILKLVALSIRIKFLNMLIHIENSKYVHNTPYAIILDYFLTV